MLQGAALCPVHRRATYRTNNIFQTKRRETAGYYRPLLFINRAHISKDLPQLRPASDPDLFIILYCKMFLTGFSSVCPRNKGRFIISQVIFLDRDESKLKFDLWLRNYLNNRLGDFLNSINEIILVTEQPPRGKLKPGKNVLCKNFLGDF